MKVVHKGIAELERALPGLISSGNLNANAVEEIRQAQAALICPFIDVCAIGLGKAFIIATRSEQIKNPIHRSDHATKSGLSQTHPFPVVPALV